MSDNIETRLRQIAQRINDNCAVLEEEFGEDDMDDGTIQEDLDTLSEAASTIAALRGEVGRLREALRRMIDRAESVPHFDDEGDLTAARTALGGRDD